MLTEQIPIPAEADLPAEIAALSRCRYRRPRHHDSTADLARIVTDLTRLDPSLAARSRDGVPRQLIGALRHFVGCVDQLAALDRALAGEVDVGRAVDPAQSFRPRRRAGDHRRIGRSVAL